MKFKKTSSTIVKVMYSNIDHEGILKETEHNDKSVW